MLNFAVGPVPEDCLTRSVLMEPTPYFRTRDFSKVMLESERLLCEFAKAPSGSRAVFLSNSGTGSMEAAVMATLNSNVDKALVVDGGGFGHRFRKLLELHEIQHDVIKLEYGNPLTREDLQPFENGSYTAFLVNLGETSQGILYDAQLIGDFCERNSLFLIVDGISSFLADPFDMGAIGADVLITDSQKALACPPGVAPMVLSPKAIERVERTNQRSMYFDLHDILLNGERGQTPFTPAVGTLLQINKRLSQICTDGGVDAEVERCANVARDFRERVNDADLPFTMRLVSPSNAVTFLTTHGFSARTLFEVLESEYGIWICPNGGAAAESSFRVGHIGSHPLSDNALLVAAFCDMKRRGYMGNVVER